MKSNWLLAALFAIASVGLLAQEPKSSSSAEQAVKGFEQQWDDALTKSDVAALEKLYAPTIVYTHSNGKVDDKASYIEAIKSGASKYLSMKRDDIKVSVYDHTAVVTCHWEAHVLSRGNKVDINARYLHVWIQQGDGWKLVAHESTRIAP